MTGIPHVFFWMQGSFQLGLVLENELQLSGECFLSREDNLARFLPTLHDRLYLFGNINVVIPVTIGGRLQQVRLLGAFLTKMFSLL